MVQRLLAAAPWLSSALLPLLLVFGVVEAVGLVGMLLLNGAHR